MKNKYKSAGILNIVIGVLGLLAILLPIILIYVLALLAAGTTEELASLIFLLTLFGGIFVIVLGSVGVYLVFMIVVGAKMTSKKEKSSGLRLAIGINVAIKLLAVYSVIYSLAVEMIGYGQEEYIMIGGTSIVIAIIFLISGIMDIIALVRKEKVE